MNISFSTEIKNEITELPLDMMEEVVLLSAFIRNNGIKERECITLTIENDKVVRYIYSLIKNIYDVNPKVVRLDNYKKRAVYNIIINDKLTRIYDELMVFKNGLYLNVPPDYFTFSEDLKRAYLRGLFLAAGSVNDPKTASYHLELLTSLAYEADFAIKLLKSFDIRAKVISRDKGYMVYVKESEKIADFLRVIGVNRAVLYFEDIRIYRDHKNMTNRLNNCEQANVDKIISSADNQINDINFVLSNIGFDLLDERIQELITYRLKYNDVSLSELADIISLETDKKITKSGINHRFRKIKELVEKIKENRG